MTRNKFVKFLKKQINGFIFVSLFVFSALFFSLDFKNINNNNFFAFSVDNKNPLPDGEIINAVVREIDGNSSEAVVDVSMVFRKRHIGMSQDDMIMELSSTKETALLVLTKQSRSVTHGFMRLVNYEEVTDLSQYSIEGLRVLLDWNGLPFPFDAYEFNVTFNPHTAYSKDTKIQEQIGAEALTVLMDDPNFIYSTNQTKLDYVEEWKTKYDILFPDSTAHIEIQRPNYVKFQVTTIIALLLFAVTWTFYRINQISVTTAASVEVIGLNLGIILAVPSIRDSIVPEGLKKVPLIDFGINLIVMLSMVSLVTYLVKLYWLKKEKSKEENDGKVKSA